MARPAQRPTRCRRGCPRARRPEWSGARSRPRPAVRTSSSSAVEHGGHEAGADALDAVRPRRAAGEDRRRAARPRPRRLGVARLSASPTPVIVPPVPTPATRRRPRRRAPPGSRGRCPCDGPRGWRDWRTGRAGTSSSRAAARAASTACSSRRATRRSRPGRRTGAAAPRARGSSPGAGRSTGRSPSPRSRTRARSRVAGRRLDDRRPPGSMRPSRSAASSIATPMRSLTDPPGSNASSLPYSSTSSPRAAAA